MMPLVSAAQGQELLVVRIGGREKVAHHLANLGIVPGSYVTVVSELNGDLIVKAKESRIALSRELAMKIYV